MEAVKEMKNIVIVGGGAGGLELTIGLARRLGMRASADITLVDRKMTHMWKPLFHEVRAREGIPVMKSVTCPSHVCTASASGPAI